jgi:hypothetical protein
MVSQLLSKRLLRLGFAVPGTLEILSLKPWVEVAGRNHLCSVSMTSPFDTNVRAK